jgi:predicted phosphodiesterase
MKLHVLSDIHLEFFAFEPPPTDADVVVLAGDTDLGTRGIEWAKKHFHDVPVVYISGNHEHYKQHLEKNLEAMRAAARDTNVHFLENDTVTIKDVTFLGCTLWSDFNAFGDPQSARQRARDEMTDYRVIRTANYRALRPYETEQMHGRSVAWLEGEFTRRRDEKVVVITHHAPSLKSIPDRFREDSLSASFSSDLDHLVAASGAPLWIHGHTHDSFDYRIGMTRVVCNPRGYVSVEPNPRFDPALLVEV